LKAYPRFGPFHEIKGILLQQTGAPEEEVRAAYMRSVALDRHNHRSRIALAELDEAADEMDSALERYDNAIEVKPEDPTAARRAAELAERLGRAEEAERRWDDLLREHPWDAAAAMKLVEARLARGEKDDDTVMLAERAVLFRGGGEAQKLLLRVHEERGDSERAAEIARAIEEGTPSTGSVGQKAEPSPEGETEGSSPRNVDTECPVGATEKWFDSCKFPSTFPFKPFRVEIDSSPGALGGPRSAFFAVSRRK
jgi:tetratricopeptide (TPR) repeat protein